MVTTGFNFEGYCITAYKGIVTADICHRSKIMFDEQWADARKEALQKLADQAKHLDADSIIGIRYEHILDSVNVHILVTGTAVTTKKA